MKPGYNIVGIRGRSDRCIDQLQFITRNSDGQYHTSPVFGGSEGREFEINSPGNLPLRFIEGRSGERLDQITFIFGYPYRVKNLKLDGDAINKKLLGITPSSIDSLTVDNPDDTELKGTYKDSTTVSESHTFHWQLSSGFTYGSKVSAGIEGVGSAEASWSISVNTTVGSSQTITHSKTREWNVPYVIPAHSRTVVKALARKAQLSGIPFTYDVEFYDPRNGRIVKTVQQQGTYNGVLVSDVSVKPESTRL